MNRALRRRHLRMVAVLGVAGAALLAAAESVHRRPVTVPSLLSLDRPTPPRRLVAETRALGLAVRLLADSGGVATHIELDPLEPIRIPDPLAYWAPLPRGTELPANAVLLGALHSGRVLRAPLPSAEGELLLYSLATRQVMATTPLPAPAAP
jgi:hypothetical protein